MVYEKLIKMPLNYLRSRTNMIKGNELTMNNKDYLNDLNKIKETIKANQNKAMVVVNSAMIMTYYQIGKIINERKQWGK